MTKTSSLKNPESVPKKMLDIYQSLTNLTNGFCSKYLNDEYAEIVRKLTAALCRKRLSPVQSGTPQTWAAGIIHAVCMINFGFDESQTPSTSSMEICSYFKKAQSTVGNKSKEIRSLLKISQWDHNWMCRRNVKMIPS